MKEKQKNELKSLLKEIDDSAGENDFSEMLSSITQLALDSIRQVNSFDERVRAFSFFALNFKKFLLESKGGFVGGVYWQCSLDSMAEQCNLLDDDHSIVISHYEEAGKTGGVVRFVDRVYEPDKVMNSMVSEMKKTFRNLTPDKIDFPTEMPES